jgi:hypothetical protein
VALTRGQLAGYSKSPFSRVAVSEEAGRYGPHFVGPFARAIDFSERESPFIASDLRTNLVEPLSDAGTMPGDFFSILLKVSGLDHILNAVDVEPVTSCIEDADRIVSFQQFLK